MATVPLTTYPLAEIIALARARSPFFERFYASLPAHPALENLPLIDPAAYWAAHARDRREVLTAPLTDGIVLNSGGTTGAPKFSYFNDEEWDSAVALSARAFDAAGLQPGDRAANLFASGNLYSSFLLVTESLKTARAGVVQFPIGISAPLADVARFIRAFDINTLVCMPTYLSTLLDHLDKEKIANVRIERILFAGEMASEGQRTLWGRRFPGVSIRSAGYASVDAGLIAFADASCGPGEHRVFDGATVVEIFDEETGELIEETGQSGKIVFTALTRRLMPVLRYPTGDRGQWEEPAGAPSRRFTLLGRTAESARVVGANLPVDEMRGILEPFRERLGIGEFQLLVTREQGLDRLTLRLVSAAPREILEPCGTQIAEAVTRQKATLGSIIADGRAHPVRVEWISRGELILNERTGKLRAVIDRRGGERMKEEG
jgi:phenylacetate-CoA ligase